MDVPLNKLSIRSFKGIESFDADFDGGHAVIKGANGTGKTSVLDAYSWLIDDKDSTGRVATGKGSFDITPLDSEGEAIKGLITKVAGEVSFDETCHVLRKELHENIVKDQLRGYTTRCWIDEVPKTVTEFQAWIKERVPEDKYRLLSSLTYFFSKHFHWKKRRGVLCEFAGEIGTPKGFAELKAALNGRTVDEYLKVLKEQKSLHEEDRDEINPKIDERYKSMEGYEQADDTDMRDERKAVTLDIERLDKTRKELLESEQQRQTNLEAVNVLCGKRVKREMELKNSTAGIQHLLDAKKLIDDAVTDRTKDLTGARNALTLKDSEVRTKNSELQADQRTLTNIRAEYTATEKKPLDNTCYACGEPLRESKQAEMETKRTVALQDISNRGDPALDRVNACKTAIEGLAHECHNLQETVGQAELKLTEAKNYRDEKLQHIDNQIAHKETIKPEDDPVWQGIVAEVKVLQDAIGESVSDQINDIETRRQPKVDRLAELDSSLARSDRHKEDKTRIAELEQKEQELAQAIADIEKQVADIEKYNATVSAMVESAVNGRFKHVEFKLFNQLLNGTLEDCCEATLRGTPYPDMSCGEKIIVGIDIINVLSEHYDLSVPLFIDNAESLTFPIESNSQTVELYAQKEYGKMAVGTREQFADDEYLRRLEKRAPRATERKQRRVAS